MSNRSFLFMRRRIPRFIHVHCKNLKSIHLRGFTLRPKSVTNFSKVFTEVKEAQFKDCCFNDVVLLELLRIDQIKVLDVQSNRRIRGTFLAALRNIRGINLSSCKCVDRRLFMKFCEEHRNLRQLVVVDCPWIDVLCLRHIAANLQNLEEIEIINWYNGAMEEDFANLALPKLKYLCIHDIHTLNHYQRAEARMDMLIQRVSTYKRLQWLNIEQIVVTKNIEKALPNFENLKFLRLHKTCKDSTLQMLTCTETLRILEIEKSAVTTHGLVTLIARCSSIRFLIISGCRNIEENFIAQILDHISGRSHMLLIWVDESVFPRQGYEKYIEINPSKLMLTYEMYPPISPPFFL